MKIEEVTAHLQNNHWQTERERDPETPGHFGKFGIWTRFRVRYIGFERHAANRTMAGASLADLWMHGAGVDGAFRHRRRRFRLRA